MGMNHPTPVSWIILLAAGMLPPGCASLTRTEYQRPDVVLPDGYFSQAKPVHGNDREAESAWWEQFGDEKLNELIEGVLSENTDVRIASVRVRRARLQAGLAADTLWIPRLSLGGNASYSNELDGGPNSESFGLNAGASYTIDLWGERRHSLDAAQWEAAATEQDLAGVHLSTSATAATLYWQLAYLDARVELSEQSIAYAEQTLELSRTRREAGAVSDLDVLQAERSLTSQRANHADLLRQRRETSNALSVLFGAPPSPTAVSVSSMPDESLPPIDAGLPADLLLRRPDVRAAELRLCSALAQSDATRASYLPSLSLSGSIGTVADTIEDLLKNPIGTLAAEVALPFLNWNEMQLTIDISETQIEESAVLFRQTLYNAIAEVENALSNREAYLAQREQLQIALAAARQSEQLFEERYRIGAVTIQDWIDAQETRRSAESALLGIEFDLLTNRIDTYEALGGSTEAGGPS